MNKVQFLDESAGDDSLFFNTKNLENSLPRSDNRQLTFVDDTL